MASIDLSPSIYLALALNGIFTGLGSALGSYLANKHIIGKSKTLLNKIKGSGRNEM